MTITKKRYLFYWLSFAIGYVFPAVYFLVKFGITKQASSIVLPTLFLCLFGIIKLSASIPKWVSTWRPSFWKGIAHSIPLYMLTIALITIGLTLKVILERQIQMTFRVYFEFVLVCFGAWCVASIFEAFHIKYRELDLKDKGYVLGVLRK